MVAVTVGYGTNEDEFKRRPTMCINTSSETKNCIQLAKTNGLGPRKLRPKIILTRFFPCVITILREFIWLNFFHYDVTIADPSLK